VRDRSSPLPIPETLDLEVDDLCFHYPLPPSYSPDNHYQGSVEEPGDVLVKVNFRLPQGKSIAVVGPSGAGKSTLINLLLRFWEYRQGRIVLDGEDLQMYDSYEIRDQAAVVAQDSYLFNTTVRENLLVAQPEASEDEMVKATKQARIHEFIESLPQGYDTYIGERGTRLSGGERQRLVLARAFLRDAPLLLFDEATAKLDAITESEVLHIIKRLVEGRSGLIVTHRLVGLETIDEIFVLREGAIVERGTHQRLMSRGGYYRKMWDLQHQELLEQ
jgi:ABC-type multidrug transport system fused ATPase/permease subunit